MKKRYLLGILCWILTSLPARAGAAQEPVTPEQVVKFFDKVGLVGQWANGILAVEQNARFPIAIRKEFNGVRYDVGLDRARFTPQGNDLDVYAMITTSEGDKICFFGREIQFTGAGGIQSGTLRLVTSPGGGLPIASLENIDLELTEGALHFDCYGYESFSLGGRVIFDRKIMVPEDPFNASILRGEVAAAFRMERVTDWNDWLLELNLPPFQITDMPGFGFTATRVVLDISRGKNSPFLFFPEGYTAADRGPGWMGVSMQALKMRFPPEFKIRENAASGRRVELGVEHLLLDRMGFSGTLVGRNIFPLASGDLNGWDFSMDEFYLRLVKNQVIKGELIGKMRLSITEENESIGYQAVIDPTRQFFQFSIQTPDSLSFPFLKASQVILTPNSQIQLVLQERQFVALARLHGQLNIQSEALGIRLEKFEFQDLVVSTRAPHLKLGFLGGGSGKSYQIGQFPISLQGPEVLVKSDSLRLRLGAMLDLDKGISASGGFAVVGRMVITNGRHYWQNTRIGLESLGISADYARFAFEGRAAFFPDDPHYGKGFYAKLSLKACLPKCLSATAVGLFGRIPGKEPHWFVDADLENRSGSTQIGMQITFLSGTVFSRMRPQPEAITRYPSITGMAYVPDENVGMGARFGVGMSLGGGNTAASAAGGLEVVTRTDGSVKTLGILGMVGLGSQVGLVNANSIREAYLTMCDGPFIPGEFAPGTPTEAEVDSKRLEDGARRFPKSGNGFYGSMLLRFNYDEESFFGRAAFNVAQSSFQFAVLGEFYFSPNRWHVHLGQPPITSRMKLRVPTFPLITFEAYLMFGHGLVALPNPEPNPFVLNPAAAADRNTGIKIDDGISGSGFAIGLSASMGSSGTVLKYVNWTLGARVGLDMMAVKFGPNVSCFGFPGPIGMNGWLASGQVYAVGEIGVAVKSIPILSVQLGALLRGTAPNPTFAQGQVAVLFRVLTKKFDLKLGFEIGDECRITRSEVKEETLAWEEKQFPRREAQHIELNTEPYVEFAYPVDKTFEVDDVVGKYRIRPVSFVLRDQNGREIEGRGRDKANRWEFNPRKELPGNTTLTGEAQVQLEYKEGGSWVPYTEDGPGLKRYFFQFKTKLSPAQLAAFEEERQQELLRKQAEQEELARIRANQEAQRQALLAYQAELHRLNETTQLVVSQIDHHLAQTKEQLTEAYHQAVAQGEKIIEKSNEVAKEIFQENTEAFNNLNNLIENTPVPEDSKVAAETTARIAKEAADEAVRQAQAQVQRIVEQATAEVLHTTEVAKQEAQQVRDNSVIQVQDIATRYENQIQDLAFRKQAQLNALNRLMKAELDGVKWPNRKNKRKAIREKYNLMVNRVSWSFNQQIATLPAQSLREQEEIKERAKHQMDAILAQAKARAEEIMNQAAAQSEEAMNRARQTAQNIMAEAENQVKAILANGPAVMDLQQFAQMLKEQTDEFDQAFNQDDFEDD